MEKSTLPIKKWEHEGLFVHSRVKVQDKYKNKRDYYQRGILEKVFWTSRPQLWLSNIHCKRILVYLEGKSWSLRSPSNSQIWCTFSFGEYEKMCNTHRPSNIQIVFKIIPFLLLPIHTNTKKKFPWYVKSSRYKLISAISIEHQI